MERNYYFQLFGISNAEPFGGGKKKRAEARNVDKAERRSSATIEALESWYLEEGKYKGGREYRFALTWVSLEELLLLQLLFFCPGSMQGFERATHPSKTRSTMR